MRMILPPVVERRQVDRHLASFFRDYGMGSFNRAITMVSRFYHLPRPVVEWFEYIDWGTTAGRTYENGKIHLVHPENWKRGRKYNSERQWIHTVHHEMAHYLFWADAEKKADTFARRMVRGIQNGTRNDRRSHARRVRARRRAAH
jgi:predicted SprT family Zn-dependent metalloprotease